MNTERERKTGERGGSTVRKNVLELLVTQKSRVWFPHTICEGFQKKETEKERDWDIKGREFELLSPLRSLCKDFKRERERETEKCIPWKRAPSQPYPPSLQRESHHHKESAKEDRIIIYAFQNLNTRSYKSTIIRKFRLSPTTIKIHQQSVKHVRPDLKTLNCAGN